MLQRGSMPTVSARAAELTEGWQESLQEDWRAALGSALQLPSTARGFMLYCLALALVGGALAVHILISVQILEAREQVGQLEREIRRVAQVNSEIVYATSLTTSVSQMVQRAEASGYSYTISRNYVDRATLYGSTTSDDGNLAAASDGSLDSQLTAGEVQGDNFFTRLRTVEVSAPSWRELQTNVRSNASDGMAAAEQTFQSWRDNGADQLSAWRLSLAMRAPWSTADGQNATQRAWQSAP